MPFVKCPECGKLNSVKLKNCPKCETSMDFARASYNSDTQSLSNSTSGNPAAPHNGIWGQSVQQNPHQPQNNNPWGQPVQQNPPQTQNNNPWGQPVQQNSNIAPICQACGNQTAAGARFCGVCGTPVAQQPKQAGIPMRKNPYCL